VPATHTSKPEPDDAPASRRNRCAADIHPIREESQHETTGGVREGERLLGSKGSIAGACLRSGPAVDRTRRKRPLKPATFNIAAQPLPNALKAFAAQSKMQLLYRYDWVSHAMASPVLGKLEKHAALEQLLRGTGLEVVYSNEHIATIRPPGAEIDPPPADDVRRSNRFVESGSERPRSDGQDA